MASKPVVRLTANFERNLESIELLLTEVEASQAFDGLLDEMLETVIPNLERFPKMGRPFLARQPRSVETTNALATLCAKLSVQTQDMDALREYVFKNYVLLYRMRRLAERFAYSPYGNSDNFRSTLKAIGDHRPTP